MIPCLAFTPGPLRPRALSHSRLPRPRGEPFRFESVPSLLLHSTHCYAGLFARIGAALGSRYLRNVRRSLWTALAGYLWFLLNNRTYQAPEYDD